MGMSVTWGGSRKKPRSKSYTHIAILTRMSTQVILSCVYTQDLDIFGENCVLLHKFQGNQKYTASTRKIVKFSRVDMRVFDIDVWLDIGEIPELLLFNLYLLSKILIGHKCFFLYFRTWTCTKFHSQIHPNIAELYYNVQFI
jgi:hypothetical protein